MRTTLAVFLTIDCGTEGAAEGVVDDLLDAGFFQDAINDHLPDGRVLCAVVRAVAADVLAAHDAHREDDGEPDEAFRARVGEPNPTDECAEDAVSCDCLWHENFRRAEASHRDVCADTSCDAVPREQA